MTFQLENFRKALKRNANLALQPYGDPPADGDPLASTKL